MIWVPESDREGESLHVPGEWVVTVIAPDGQRNDIMVGPALGHFELAATAKAIEHFRNKWIPGEATG